MLQGFARECTNSSSFALTSHDTTASEWPCSTCVQAPVEADQMRSVPSKEAVYTWAVRESGVRKNEDRDTCCGNGHFKMQ